MHMCVHLWHVQTYTGRLTHTHTHSLLVSFVEYAHGPSGTLMDTVAQPFSSVTCEHLNGHVTGRTDSSHVHVRLELVHPFFSI